MSIPELPNQNTNYLPWLHSIYNLLAPLGSIGLLVLLLWLSFWFLKFKFGNKEEEKNGNSERTQDIGHITETERTSLHQLGMRIEQHDKKFIELETTNARILSVLQQDTNRWDSIILKIGELSGKMESIMADKKRH